MATFNNTNGLASADYVEMYPQIQKTIVCSLGGYAMKQGWRSEVQVGTGGYTYQGAELLLPKPNPSDCSPENTLRYKNYRERACIIEFTKRTKTAFLGFANFKPHQIELPDSIDYLIFDADNSGTALNEQVKMVLSDMMDQGTGALLVDIPSRGNVSAADVQSGIRANIKVYDGLNVMKAAYSVINHKKMLSYVLLREQVATIDHETNQDEYSIQYRRLTLEKLESGAYVYKHELLGDDASTLLEDPAYPTDFSGRNLDYIPLFPIGTMNNSLEVLDPPLLLPIAELNIGQYRNSADVEENAYQSSQSTTNVFADQLPDDFVYYQGASAVNTLPQDAKVEILQATESNLSDKLQLQKVKDAASIGASLILGGGAEQKVEVVKMEMAANMASLSGLIKNIELAYHMAIDACQQIMSAQVTDEYQFELNQEFFPSTIAPEKLAKWMEMVQLGMAPMEYFIRMMVKAGEFPEGATEQDVRELIATQKPVK